ncbi:50S ribosome-binding protein YggL [Brevibacillus centrosporus]|uniref:50S ribosome-binding protein YggL n=1 Tax=Brevibacillus centrosporus TaxID=54910 RepID=UPI001476E329|nr:50S ribosome-binding protein YggL [Brevibacillus centrosporus]MEC2129336.1 50S ribosome-binding protein YggL [Brevibacillus centrosporus]
MSILIQVNGVVEIKDTESHDEFLDKFIEFVERNGWFFGGGTQDITDNEDEKLD